MSRYLERGECHKVLLATVEAIRESRSNAGLPTLVVLGAFPVCFAFLCNIATFEESRYASSPVGAAQDNPEAEQKISDEAESPCVASSSVLSSVDAEFRFGCEVIPEWRRAYFVFGHFVASFPCARVSRSA